MESAVTIAFSSAHVTVAENTCTAARSFPFGSAPSARCARAVCRNWRAKRGTNRSAIENSSENAGAARPKSAMSLSEVSTRWKLANHSAAAASIVPAASP